MRELVPYTANGRINASDGLSDAVWYSTTKELKIAMDYSDDASKYKEGCVKTIWFGFLYLFFTLCVWPCLYMHRLVFLFLFSNWEWHRNIFPLMVQAPAACIAPAKLSLALSHLQHHKHLHQAVAIGAVREIIRLMRFAQKSATQLM